MNDEQRQLFQRIEAFPLDQPDTSFNFSARLSRENRWPRDFTLRAIEEYRRFAFLAVAAGHPVTPSDQVDQVWHLHLTYTRPYWEEFCPKVLGRPLHHLPTQGGKAEGEKFDRQYRQTLESYRRLFGEAPPEDLWPAPELRFGRDLQFVRVNTRTHWLLPKPRSTGAMARGAAMLALCLALPAFLGSCEGSVAFFNPMKLNGPEFLGFYGLTGLALLLLARLLRWSLCLPDSAGQPLDPSLSAEELAYLAGGTERALDTALLSLVQAGHVSLEPDGRSLKSHPTAEGVTSRLEQAIAGAIEANGTIGVVRRRVRLSELPFLSIRERLQKLGMLVDPARSRTAQIGSGLLLLPLLLLGVIRLVHGIEIGRPVGFLMVLLVVFTGFAAHWMLTPLERSPYGDRVVARARDKRRAKWAPQGLLETVALLGTSALIGTAFAEVGSALRRAPAGYGTGGNGDGGSDGGGDGGGGCGGGGCGGCGGS